MMKSNTFMQSWRQESVLAQDPFDIAQRYIPKMIKEGIKQRY